MDRRSLGVDLALRIAVGSSDPPLAEALASYRDEGAALLKASPEDVDRADTEFELLLADYLTAQRAEAGQAHARARANLAEAGKGTHAALDQMRAIAQAEELRANNRRPSSCFDRSRRVTNSVFRTPRCSTRTSQRKRTRRRWPKPGG